MADKERIYIILSKTTESAEEKIVFFVVVNSKCIKQHSSSMGSCA